MQSTFTEERNFMSKVKFFAWVVYLTVAVLVGRHIFSHSDDHGWRVWLPWLELIGFGFVSILYQQFCEAGFRLWEKSIRAREEQHRIAWEVAKRDLEKQQASEALGSETFKLN